MKKDMAENEMDFDCGNEMESEGEMDIDNEYDDTMSQVDSDSFDGDTGDEFYEYDETDMSENCMESDGMDEFYDDDQTIKEVLDSTDYMNSLDAL